MKIAFVNPNLHGEFRVNISIAALLSYITKRTTHKVDLIDVTFHRRTWKRYVKQILLKFQPDIIGVSVLTYNFYDSLQIVQWIKELHPQVYVIYGGVHVALFPLETLKYKIIDAIVLSDGEFALEKVLDAMERNKSLEGIPGVYFKSKGKIIKNSKPQFIENLDSLPYLDCSLFELDKYELVNPYEIPILGSRGCPFECTFCINPILAKVGEGKYVRWRSPENIISEMKWHSKRLDPQKFMYFYLWDDMFNLRPEYVKKFCELFIKAGFPKHYTWSCASRADTIDEPRIKLLAESNLNLTRIGIEAGNPIIRNEIYCKKISTRQIFTAMSLCHKYKINTQTDYIVGGPRDTLHYILQSFYMIRITDPTQISISTFQPWPMLKATELFVSDGGQIQPNDWKKITTFFNQPAKHGRITHKELKSITIKINGFFLRRIIWRYFKKEKFRFLYDVMKFLFYLKWRYNFLWHDLFKYTIRKYIYEENLQNIRKL